MHFSLNSEWWPERQDDVIHTQLKWFDWHYFLWLPPERMCRLMCLFACFRSSHVKVAQRLLRALRPAAGSGGQVFRNWRNSCSLRCDLIRTLDVPRRGQTASDFPFITKSSWWSGACPKQLTSRRHFIKLYPVELDLMGFCVFAELLYVR